jgi:tRNA-2-methylthio-N6-dimethylallyladenosine synthase
VKKVYIETYGCQMNVYDTEIIKTILVKEGYEFTDVPEKADALFLNTCSVRENAHQKVRQRINVLKQLKRNNKKLIMGVVGCMAQNLRNELLEDKVGVDIVAGPDSYRKLPDMISHVEKTGEKDFALTLSEYETYSDIFPTHEKGINAWVAVMRGCDNFCTFCVVPYTRGRERSRDPQNVRGEVEKLALQGFKQVTLLGQNVNSYKYESYDFAALMELVSEIQGIKRIRFTSPHPKDFPDRLLSVIAENPKICKHIHLPLQAGNNRILDLMNRTYTKEEFLSLVNKIRRKIPDIVLTTDIIVGFPGETEEEFQDTLDLIQKVEFDSAFMFKYSERKNTIASKKFPDDVSDEYKTSRITRLVDLQRSISNKKNNAHIGQVFDVLIEGPAKKRNQLSGRNDGNKIVVFNNSGNFKTGDIVKVKIEEASTNTLIGIVVGY